MANEMRDYLEQRERDLEARVEALTAKCSALTALAEQYRNDMRHPPAPDSRERRIAWINKVLG